MASHRVKAQSWWGRGTLWDSWAITVSERELERTSVKNKPSLKPAQPHDAQLRETCLPRGPGHCPGAEGGQLRALSWRLLASMGYGLVSRSPECAGPSQKRKGQAHPRTAFRGKERPGGHRSLCRGGQPPFSPTSSLKFKFDSILKQQLRATGTVPLLRPPQAHKPEPRPGPGAPGLTYEIKTPGVNTQRELRKREGRG